MTPVPFDLGIRSIRRHASRLALAAIVLVPIAASAQSIPDTTAAWDYFPLALGYLWQYDIERSGDTGECWICHYVEEHEVVGTRDLNERTYYVVAVRRDNLPQPINTPPRDTFLVRFDTTLAFPVIYRGEEQPVDHLGCRLDEAFPPDPEEGRPVDCVQAKGDLMSVRGGYDLTTRIASTDYVVTTKAFAWFMGSVEYAAGIGIVKMGGAEGGFGYQTLRYALIGTREYGRRFVSLGAGEPETAMHLRAYPNPARGTVHLEARLATLGEATVSVFDVLGRIVHRQVAMAPANDLILSLDASGWAAGQYTVRLTSNGDSQTARLTVR